MKYAWFVLSLFLFACNSSSNSASPTATSPTKEVDNSSSTDATTQALPKANVTEVTAQGDNGRYTFYVTVKSDETGCDQYADWWEVLSAKGDLLYRRILVHSHPTDQPFTRSGGSVNIQTGDTVYIRAHMNKAGYTGEVFMGSVSGGFLKASSTPDFSKSIETQAPLPNGCAF